MYSEICGSFLRGGGGVITGCIVDRAEAQWM